ncbi:hypothetical protein [Mycobacteroides abscessus]
MAKLLRRPVSAPELLWPLVVATNVEQPGILRAQRARKARSVQ